MGVLRALVLVSLASGCTEVVVDPFGVQVEPPPPDLVDVYIDIQGAWVAEGLQLFFNIPTVGPPSEQTVTSGGATYHYPSALEAGTPSVLVAGFFDRDFDRCCMREIDPSFAREVTLDALGANILLGTLAFEPETMELPMEDCPFFRGGDPVCMGMEMPGP